MRAINRQDVDGLTALMAPDHRFVDSMGNLCEGREEMRTAWIGYFLIFPDYSVTLAASQFLRLGWGSTNPWRASASAPPQVVQIITPLQSTMEIAG